jgi:hypothetical protein
MSNVSHHEGTTMSFAIRASAMLLLAMFEAPAVAQLSYDQELTELSGSLRALMVRAERVQARDPAIKLAVQQELFELSKRLHRLEEEAMAANTELLRTTNVHDRQPTAVRLRLKGA